MVHRWILNCSLTKKKQGQQKMYPQSAAYYSAKIFTQVKKKSCKFIWLFFPFIKVTASHFMMAKLTSSWKITGALLVDRIFEIHTEER